MELRFTKMHGLGNDFVVVDGVRQEVRLTPAQVAELADRRFGVGFDQLLIAGPADQPDADLRYRIFNSDGVEVEQCGNGARCLALFARREGLAAQSSLRLQTLSRIIEARVGEDEEVTVDMGAPILEPAAVPFEAAARAARYRLDTALGTVEAGVVSMGNPHAVTVVADVTQAPVSELGPILESHPRFAQRTNVGFMEIVDPKHVRLRVYERGVGETLACGTGACAAVVVGCLQDQLQERVRVDLPGGRLMVSWRGEGTPVLMTGPGTFVFEGVVCL